MIESLVAIIIVVIIIALVFMLVVVLSDSKELYECGERLTQLNNQKHSASK
jgi:biopolymer transport protein ExbB/TolQ